MKKIFTACLILGFIATTNAMPAYSFKLFGQKKANISTTQTPKEAKTKKSIKLFKKAKNTEKTAQTETKKQKTKVKSEKKKLNLNPFKKGTKAATETVPSTGLSTQSLEAYIDSMLQKTITDISGTNDAAEKIFLHSVAQVSTKRQYKKMKSKINRINKQKKLTTQQKMEKISDIMQNYADKYMHKNRIGLVATVAKLPSANQNALMNDVGSLNDCASMYITAMQNTYEAGESIKRLTNNSDKLANSLKTIKNTSKTLNKSARATMTMARSLNQLILESGINQK